MLLGQLREFDSVEDAAKGMAGNWTKWKNFVWYGAKDIPEADQCLFGYLVNHEGNVRDEVDLAIVEHRLKGFLGDMRNGADAMSIESDLCGDPGALKGVVVRVFKNGEITKAFRKLYDTAVYLVGRDPEDYGRVEESIYNKIQRQAFRTHIGFLGKALEGLTEEQKETIVQIMLYDDFDEIWDRGEIEEKYREALKEVLATPA